MDKDYFPSLAPIFIVGVPRSGTTLLRAILSAHPAITIAPESHFFRFWYSHYRYLDLNDRTQFQIFWQAFSSSTIFASFGLSSQLLLDRLLAAQTRDFKTVFSALMQFYTEKMGKSRWGEKTPDHYHHLSTIFDWYPSARVIWIVRDPRAVSASLIGKAWASSQVEVHAQTWIDSVRQYNLQWAIDPRVLLIQYEHFVTAPEAQICRLSEFLGENLQLEDTARSPSILGLSERSLGEHYQAALSPIHATALDKWRSHLSPYQIAIVEHFTREGMEQYQYVPLTKSLNTQQRVQFWLRQKLRHLKRVLRSSGKTSRPILP
jgi:hypothetical protein